MKTTRRHKHTYLSISSYVITSQTAQNHADGKLAMNNILSQICENHTQNTALWYFQTMLHRIQHTHTSWISKYFDIQNKTPLQYNFFLWQAFHFTCAFTSLCLCICWCRAALCPITLLTLISAPPPRRSEASCAGEELGERQVSVRWPSCGLLEYEGDCASGVRGRGRRRNTQKGNLRGEAHTHTWFHVVSIEKKANLWDSYPHLASCFVKFVHILILSRKFWREAFAWSSSSRVASSLAELVPTLVLGQMCNPHVIFFITSIFCHPSSVNKTQTYL